MDTISRVETDRSATFPATAGALCRKALLGGLVLLILVLALAQQALAQSLSLLPPAGALPAGTVGFAYSETLTATGGSGSYVYSVSSGSLPPGLQLDATSGEIHGTPTQIHSSSLLVTLTATDTSDPALSVSAQYRLGVGSDTRLNDATVGVPYPSARVSTAGLTTPSSGSLPPGMMISVVTSARSELVGTPEQAGTYSFVFTTGNRYTITVQPASLTLMPADGTHLPAGTVGESYAYTSISASGGAGGITFTASGLPDGLTIDPDTGAITGTPALDGTFSATITATAAASGSASATYTIAIASAPPVLTSVSPASGPTEGNTSITIVGHRLTEATSLTIGGVAATGVTVVSDTTIIALTPANVSGAADISVTTSQGTATLPSAFTYIEPTFAFSPASGVIPEGTAGVEYSQPVSVTGGTAPYRFSSAGLPEGMGIDAETGTIRGLPTTPGNATIIVTVQDQAGLTGTATYTLSIGGIHRPDPTRDAEVTGLVNAMVQSAERFASTQIRNFNDRLERLHNDQSRGAHSINVRFGLMQNSEQAQQPTGHAEQTQIDYPADHAAQLSAVPLDTETDNHTPPGDPLAGDIAFWTGGFVNFGTTDHGNIDLEHTLIGVSGGVDYRFRPDFVGGIGFGYGRDKTDIGSNGTESTARAFSAVIYGSYHPEPFYLDGLFGVSRLDFDSKRYVTMTGDFATGSRDGTQVFGSLSGGYEHRQGGLLFSPYGRIESAYTRLDGFDEAGAGPYGLAFGQQTFDMLAGVAGTRAEYAMPMDWGVFNTRGRLEYTHDFTGSSQASMGYADLGTLPYTLDLDSYMRNYLSVGLGIDVKVDSGMVLSFDYRTAFGFDGDARNDTIGIRLGSSF